jgi:hypothetical protein
MSSTKTTMTFGLRSAEKAGAPIRQRTVLRRVTGRNFIGERGGVLMMHSCRQESLMARRIGARYVRGAAD